MTASRTTARSYLPDRLPPRAVDGARVRIDVHRRPSHDGALAHDVRIGLLAPHKTLPPKYFYDDRGARLFDAICDLPEYYLTRTEQALLEDVVDDIVAVATPRAVVEFGSGASRKTRVVLDALARSRTTRSRTMCYVPMDVSEGMLRRSAARLVREYPRLRVHAVVGDYEHDLGRLPHAAQRLVMFLGSTIGNFTPAATARFLADVRRQLSRGDYFLVGLDLVKSVEILEAAYNDGAGLTAEFNRNMLRVINRHLDADFDVESFEHVAFFNRAQSQIEMHLRARTAHTVAIRRLDLRVPFGAGETIHTEISRKFTCAEAESMLHAAGFQLSRWYAPPNNYFGLALATVA